MTEQEKKSWVQRNLDNFDNEAEAIEYLERRLREEEAKKSRVLKTFNDLDELRVYEKNHNLGKWWQDLDNDTICAYEYK